MSKRYDVVDEVHLEAPPEAVYNALVDLFRGKATWWAPHLLVEPRGPVPAGLVGAESRLRVRRGPTMDARLVEAVPPTLLKSEYVGGDFRGTATWTLVADGAGTRLTCRWQTIPASLLMRLFARVIDIPARHSTVMKHGFDGLAKVLVAEHRQPP